MGSIPGDDRPCSSSYMRSGILAKAPEYVTALWEPARREGVIGERRMLRAADDVVRGFSFAFQQEVGLADGVGFGVDLLAVEVVATCLPCSLARSSKVSSATVSMPPVPQAPS